LAGTHCRLLLRHHQSVRGLLWPAAASRCCLHTTTTINSHAAAVGLLAAAMAPQPLLGLLLQGWLPSRLAHGRCLLLMLLLLLLLLLLVAGTRAAVQLAAHHASKEGPSHRALGLLLVVVDLEVLAGRFCSACWLRSCFLGSLTLLHHLELLQALGQGLLQCRRAAVAC
jgi:hypothetical protein